MLNDVAPDSDDWVLLQILTQILGVEDDEGVGE